MKNKIQKVRKPFLQPVIWKGNNEQWYLAIHHFRNCEELMRVSEGNGYSKSAYCRKLATDMESPNMLPFLELKAGKVFYDGQEVKFPKKVKWIYRLIKSRLPKRK